MKCLEKGCSKEVVAGSNYCRDHKPGMSPVFRKAAMKKAAAKKPGKKATKKATKKG